MFCNRLLTNEVKGIIRLPCNNQTIKLIKTD